jgi:cytochrome c553
MRKHLAAAALLAAFAVPAGASAQGNNPPADVKAECTNCHMFFPANWLSAESWTKLMGNLSNHFGEDATLSEAKRAKVLEFLVANSADSKTGRMSPAAKAPDGSIPMRLTETQAFLRKHGKMRASAFSDPRVKSKANCVACHKEAEQGIFED